MTCRMGTWNGLPTGGPFGLLPFTRLIPSERLISPRGQVPCYPAPHLAGTECTPISSQLHSCQARHGRASLQALGLRGTW